MNRSPAAFARLTVLWYALTVFTSAALLLMLELMTGKMLLPVLGGSAAVWTTCLVFFQAALLAGYWLAHVLPTWLGVRTYSVLHLVLTVVPSALLPFQVTDSWAPPADGSNPAFWVLGLLLTTVGPPFVVAAATAPLVQRWLAETDTPAGRDPYFLYAASNAGSLLGLLGYPFLIEPALPVSRQSAAWLVGYLALLALLSGCVLLLWLSPRRDEPAVPADESHSRTGPRGPTAVDRVWWVVLSFVPSSLLLGSTAYLTTDVAAIPLLWVAPLTVYFLTFIMAFATRPLIPHRLVVRSVPAAGLLMVLLLNVRFQVHYGLELGAHLLCLFVASLACHGELARRRPAAVRLTGFYLWVSVGGLCGGVFNALLAPLVFPGFFEYPLAVALSTLVMKPTTSPSRGPRSGALDLAVPTGLAVLSTAFLAAREPAEVALGIPVATPGFGVLCFLCYLTVDRPARFGLSLAVLLLAQPLVELARPDLLFAGRSFYGTHRVVRRSDQGREAHLLIHGSTAHGLQWTADDRRGDPTLYYTRGGPLAQIFAALPADRRDLPIAVVGLGAGTTACYCRPGQRLDYFEIDPLVLRVAEDPALFTYLQDCRARGGHYTVRLGDGRRELARQPAGSYGVIMLDAFSSDAIPAHLLTREALEQVYLPRLAPHGVVVFHLSNRYLRLARVIGGLTRATGLSGLGQTETDDSYPAAEANQGRAQSVYAVVARAPDDFGPLAGDPRWRPLVIPGGPVWTDDRTDLLGVLWGQGGESPDGSTREGGVRGTGR